MNTRIDQKQELLTDLQQQKTTAELDERLQQLLTPTEYEEVVTRLQIIKLLEQGVPQRKIAETLGVGIATVSRGARALKERQTQP